jgi:hypothetical protein
MMRIGTWIKVTQEFTGQGHDKIIEGCELIVSKPMLTKQEDGIFEFILYLAILRPNKLSFCSLKAETNRTNRK